MPSPFPRINVVVSQEQRDLLAELGAIQGRSAASYLRELLDMATPLYRSLMPVLRASQDVRDQVSAGIEQRVAELVQQALTGKTADGQVDLEEFIAAASAAACADVGGAGGRAGSLAGERSSD